MSDEAWKTALANKVVPLLVFLGVMTVLVVAMVNKQAIATIHALADEGIRVIHSLKGCT